MSSKHGPPVMQICAFRGCETAYDSSMVSSSSAKETLEEKPCRYVAEGWKGVRRLSKMGESKDVSDVCARSLSPILLRHRKSSKIKKAT